MHPLPSYTFNSQVTALSVCGYGAALAPARERCSNTDSLIVPLSTPIYIRDPLADGLWSEFLDWERSASVFHSAGWLTALHRTYSYRPLIATTCSPGADLSNGLVFCLVPSFLTGRRLVSLPFSDHCEPLAGSEAELDGLLNCLPQLLKALRCPHLEIRPLRAVPPTGAGFGPAVAYFSHEIDLTRSPAEVFGSFHKDSVQRKIRRAERENLRCEEGRSEKLIADFYGLLLLTRRRHQLPPQPLAWFQNLAACMKQSMQVRVAYSNDKAIASIITLQFKDSLVYKYGCSDQTHHNLGGMQLLFWRAIQEAIGCGLRVFDLGRTEIENDGLATFKERWGATRRLLPYWTAPPVLKNGGRSWRRALAGRIFARIPDRLLVASGRLLYRHFG